MHPSREHATTIGSTFRSGGFGHRVLQLLQRVESAEGYFMPMKRYLDSVAEVHVEFAISDSMPEG
jgi:hypothetical protein